MSDRSTTMYDVAVAAGVPVQRVRRWYAGNGRVTRNQRERILQAAEQLGFQPSFESPRYPGNGGNRPKRIAIVCRHTTAYSFAQRIRGISRTLSHHEFEVVTYNVESPDHLSHYLNMLARPGVIDGIVIMALPISPSVGSEFRKRSIPVVSIERAFPGIPSITVDNREGGRLAARYLLKKGYRNPAYMGDEGTNEYDFNPAALRLSGFSEALDEAGIRLPENHISLHPMGAANVPEMLARLVQEEHPPDCLFCSSDLEAIVAIRTAHDLGLQIPGDLGILGFDDIELADYLGLSSVDQHLERSGEDAARILSDGLSGTGRKPVNLSYELVIRERWTT